MPRPCLVALILAASLAFGSGARANWSSDPTVGLPVLIEVGDQGMADILADGYGGAWIAWTDGRGGSPAQDIRMQHVLASGIVDPGWPADGLLVCGALRPQQSPKLASDGGGGVYVVWHDFRVANTNPDIYWQHVFASGVVDPAWPVNGTAITLDLGFDYQPLIMADGAGGAFVCFAATSVNPVIRVHHMLSTGLHDPAWTTAGIRLSLTNQTQNRPQMVSDGAGGVVVAWDDLRNGLGDVYAMRVLATGQLDPQWPVNGALLCNATGTQISVRLASDGAGGAIAAWTDERVSSLGDIYAQRVLATGVVDPVWPPNGRAVCDTIGAQVSANIVSDGAHGCIVTWQDVRSGDRNLYARHLLADGSAAPGSIPNGFAICSAAGEQQYAALTHPMLSDGAGGAFLAWHDLRGGGTTRDIYAMHILSSGAPDPAWPADGRAVCTSDGNQVGPVIAPDGSGGMLVTWSDNRGGVDYDIYAQRVAQNGTLPNVGVEPGAQAGAVRFEVPWPNPSRASVAFRYASAVAGSIRLDVLDVTGRFVRGFAPGIVPMGEHELRWDLRDDRGRAVANGIYFARLHHHGHVLSRRIIVLR